MILDDARQTGVLRTREEFHNRASLAIRFGGLRAMLKMANRRHSIESDLFINVFSANGPSDWGFGKLNLATG